MKHRYADIICAWANGRTIQYKDGNTWRDMQYNETYRLDIPDWTNLRLEWRIKPECIKYRVALMLNIQIGQYYTTNAHEKGLDISQSPDFIKWLTDWIILEIPI